MAVSTSFIYQLTKTELQSFLDEHEGEWTDVDNVAELRKKAVAVFRDAEHVMGQKGDDRKGPESLIMKETLRRLPALEEMDVKQVLAFLIEVEKIRRLGLVTDTVLLQCAVFKCLGPFQVVAAEALTGGVQGSLNVFKAKLLDYVCTPSVRRRCVRDFVHRPQSSNEPLYRFIESVVDHEAALGLNTSEEDLVSLIIDNMSDVYKSRCVLVAVPRSLRDMRRLAVELESKMCYDCEDRKNCKFSKPKKEGTGAKGNFLNVAEGDAGASSKEASTSREGAGERRQGRCANCSKFGHVVISCPQPRVEPSKRVCFRCGRQGHVRYHCPGNGPGLPG